MWQVSICGQASIKSGASLGFIIVSHGSTFMSSKVRHRGQVDVSP